MKLQSLILMIILTLAACESARHKREYLQREYPDCIVSEELEVICPEPDWKIK